MLFSFAKSIKPFVQGDPKAQLQGRADGASRGNPGHAGAGWTIYSMPTGAVLSDHHKYIGNTTNNVAEYKAMCSLLLELRVLRDIFGSMETLTEDLALDDLLSSAFEEEALPMDI